MTREPKKKRKLPLFLVLILGILGFLLWLISGGLLGSDFGLGLGSGDDTAEESADAGPCKLRLDKAGLTLDGEAVPIEAAVAECKKSGEALLVVTGDANYGELERTRAALEAAGVSVMSKEQR